MKKRNCIVIICLSLMTLIACSSDYSEVIERNWGISLQKGYKELFSIDSGASFHGDGTRYHIFYYKKGIEIEKFSPEKNTNLEDEIEKILNSLQMDAEKKPDFSKEYYWYKKSGDNDSRNKLYLIYFKEHNLLHIIEDFY